MELDFTMTRWTVVLWLNLALSGSAMCHAQEGMVVPLPDAPSAQYAEQDDPESKQAKSWEAAQDTSSQGSMLDRMRDLPTRWLLGSAVTRGQELSPLTNDERLQLYLRQTYLNPGTYAKRLVGGGIDQARGVPDEWGGGLRGYEKQVASRYGQFVIQNTLKSAGDAAVGYEPRYDLCRCQGFWPRTKHAIIRNFVTYDSTERELRPQVPLYGAAFVAGMTASSWKPGPRNIWAGGAYGMAQQAGWGILSNWLSEFSGDIGRKISRRH